MKMLQLCIKIPRVARCKMWEAHKWLVAFEETDREREREREGKKKEERWRYREWEEEREIERGGERERERKREKKRRDGEIESEREKEGERGGKRERERERERERNRQRPRLCRGGLTKRIYHFLVQIERSRHSSEKRWTLLNSCMLVEDAECAQKKSFPNENFFSTPVNLAGAVLDIWVHSLDCNWVVNGSQGFSWASLNLRAERAVVTCVRKLSGRRSLPRSKGELSYRGGGGVQGMLPRKILKFDVTKTAILCIFNA